MLSYRKSQQASLTEKLKKKNVIHVLGVSGSGTTMARLCLSAFARVATGFLRVYRQRRPLCFSAFVRVATHQIVGAGLKTALCLSAFARVATPWILLLLTTWGTLPQRIRAGCDLCVSCKLVCKQLCHSAFVRVATSISSAGAVSTGLCHSAFVRVATAEKQCSALRICCEKVDSFSSVGESGLALTIFPFSFAAKATYVAINDSFGRAIDRFFGANRTGISVSYDFAEHPCL